jgi:hypothetical protein
MSTAKAAYVVATSYCAQLLWMKQTLKDFRVSCGVMPLLCDNESAIKIVHNPVQHERTKHIDFCHHFLRDHMNLGNISLMHIKTEEQLVDIFMKPL